MLLEKENLKIFAYDFISKGIGYVFLPWFLANMGQREFGLYTYIIYIISAGSGIIGLGLSTSLSALYSSKDYKKGDLLNVVAVTQLVFYCLILLIFLISDLDVSLFHLLIKDDQFVYSDYRYGIYFYLLFLLIYSITSIYHQFSGDMVSFQKYNALRLLASALFSIVGIKILRIQSDILRINIEAIISIIIFIPVIVKYIKQSSSYYSRPLLLKCLKIGMPIIGNSIVFLFVSIADKFYLQKYSGVDDLAVYNLSLQLAAPLAFLFTAVNLVWLPIFFGLDHWGEVISQTKKIFKQVMVALLVIILATYTIVYYGVNNIDVYSHYRLVLLIYPFLALSVILDGLCSGMNNFLIKADGSKYIFYIGLLNVILMLYLNEVLVPSWGIIATVMIVLSLSMVRLMVSLLLFLHIKNTMTRNRST